MSIRLRSRIHRVIGCTITLLVVVIPLQALADEPLIESAVEPASPTAGVVEDVVEPVADTADDVVEPVAEVVDDAEETAGGTVEEVDDATTEVVNEAPTVEEAEETAADTSGQVQGNTGAAANDVSEGGGSAKDAIAGSDGSTSTGGAPGGGKEPSDRKQAPHRDLSNDERITVLSPGSAWRRMHFAQLGMAVPATSFFYQSVALLGGPADEPEVDPCEDDPGLACLGLLFGIGEFAKAGGVVLGLFMAATGVALRGLTVLAFALLLAGVVALSIAPRRATPGEGMG